MALPIPNLTSTASSRADSGVSAIDFGSANNSSNQPKKLNQNDIFIIGIILLVSVGIVTATLKSTPKKPKKSKQTFPMKNKKQQAKIDKFKSEN